MSIFKKVKAKGSVAKGTKTRDIHVIKDTILEKEILRLADLNEKIDLLSAEASTLHSSIKTKGIDKYLDMYDTEQKNPKTLAFKAGKGEFMFIPMDKYLKIDEDAKEALSEISESLIEEKTVFTIDPILLEKYEKVISNMIMRTKKISDEDKENLFSASITYSVKKGTIDRLHEFKGHSISEMFEVVKPIVSLKNIKAEETV